MGNVPANKFPAFGVPQKRNIGGETNLSNAPDISG